MVVSSFNEHRIKCKLYGIEFYLFSIIKYKTQRLKSNADFTIEPAKKMKFRKGQPLAG